MRTNFILSSAIALALPVLATSAHAAVVAAPTISGGSSGVAIATEFFGSNDYLYDNFSATGGDSVDAQVVFTATASTTVLGLTVTGNGLIEDLNKYDITLYDGAYEGVGIAPAIIADYSVNELGTGSGGYSFTFADFDVLSGDSFTLSWVASTIDDVNSLDYTFTTTVPVPAALPLFLTAIGGLVAVRRRKS